MWSMGYVGNEETHFTVGGILPRFEGRPIDLQGEGWMDGRATEYTIMDIFYETISDLTLEKKWHQPYMANRFGFGFLFSLLFFVLTHYLEKKEPDKLQAHTYCCIKYFLAREYRVLIISPVRTLIHFFYNLSCCICRW